MGHSVLVTNISANSNEKTVSDFFSFCGKISKLYMKKENDESFSAVVEFESESAAKTALLLSNALIGDKPITVVEFQEKEEANIQNDTQYNSVPKENITERPYNVPDESRSKTSVVASMISSGYILGKDTIQKASDYDKSHGFTQKAQQVVDQVIEKLEQIDQQYKVTETAIQTGKKIQESAKKIDEDYKIKEKVQNATTSVTTSVVASYEKAKENPTVATSINTVKSYWNEAKQTWNDVKTETEKQIQEKEKQRNDSKPATDVPTSSTSTTDVPTPNTITSTTTTTTEQKDPEDTEKVHFGEK